MTFKELAEGILKLPPERQAEDATVSCDFMEESFPVTGLITVVKNDFLEGVLDEGHAIITINV
jgi:hypothetical protein